MQGIGFDAVLHGHQTLKMTCILKVLFTGSVQKAPWLDVTKGNHVVYQLLLRFILNRHGEIITSSEQQWETGFVH